MIRKLNVLVACEFSGTVRDAFARLGHNAVSCDLLPSETPGEHYIGSVVDLLHDGWDLMIAHPPCTHLAVSGAAHFAAKIADGRQQAALEFVRTLLDAPIPHIALENPVSIISTRIRRPDQIIHPYQFGHADAKTTCLWLKNLPLLAHTHLLEMPYHCKCGYSFPASLGKYGCPDCCGDSGPAVLRWNNTTPSGQNKLGPSPTRAKNRARTYKYIAVAMARQWGEYVGGL